MSTMYLAFGIVCSLAIIAWLWHSDAKRRRVAGLPILGASDKRWIIAVAALIPGVILAARGDSPSFLIWLGACAMGGWIVAQVRPRNS
jgi:hypothetical protein